VEGGISEGLGQSVMTNYGRRKKKGGEGTISTLEGNKHRRRENRTPLVRKRAREKGLFFTKNGRIGGTEVRVRVLNY